MWRDPASRAFHSASSSGDAILSRLCTWSDCCWVGITVQLGAITSVLFRPHFERREMARDDLACFHFRRASGEIASARSAASETAARAHLRLLAMHVQLLESFHSNEDNDHDATITAQLPAADEVDPVFFSLFEAKCIDRVETSSSARRKITEDYADCGGKAERDEVRFHVEQKRH